MFSETFTDDRGQEKTVFASSEADLKEAVKNAKEVKPATYPNINVPVKKGHDLVEVDEALNTELVDGTGAHNSPRDAVRDDGSFEGDPEVVAPGLDEAPLKEAGTGEPVGDPAVKADETEKSE
jgi:hypothetical protein